MAGGGLEGVNALSIINSHLLLFYQALIIIKNYYIIYTTVILEVLRPAPYQHKNSPYGLHYAGAGERTRTSMSYSLTSS